MMEPAAQELAAKLVALEERMNTKQAEYKTDIALLGKQMAERMSAQDARMAENAVENAKRETRLLLAIAGMFGLATAILGVLIRLSQ